MNVRIVNHLHACAPFTPRTFAANHITTDAVPVSQLELTSVNAQQASNRVGVVTVAAHWLRSGDRVTITGADATYLNGTHPVTVTSATSFTVGPFVEASSDAEILGAVMVANIWFSRAAVFAKTVAGADNGSALKLGYSATLLPIDLASAGEYGFVAPDGARMTLAELYVKPAAAAANGLVCLLY